MALPVLYDCDNTFGLTGMEVDDGLTLLYLLGCPDIEVVGVTTTFGNGTLAQVHSATRALVQAAGRPSLPLHQGAATRNAGTTPAARFLVEQVRARPGELTLLATGPLGNLSAAAALASDFLAKVRHIIVMGGYLHPLRIGSRMVAELNFSCDPVAAHTVLHAPCPVTVINAHVCLEAPFSREDVARLAHWGAPVQDLIQAWLDVFGSWCAADVFYLWDLLPAVYLSHPELFVDGALRIASTVDDLENGLLVAGTAGPEITMPAHIRDRDRFMALLHAAWQRVALDTTLLAPLRNMPATPLS